MITEELETLSVRDADQLAAVEEACFAQPLSSRQIRSLTETQNATFVVVRSEETLIVGSVWVQTVLDEGYIGNVAVLSSFRRQGFADALLEALDRFAEKKGLRFLTLEVRESNIPAICLYDKHGYHRVGVRPAYYTAPKENAILMTKYYGTGE